MLVIPVKTGIYNMIWIPDQAGDDKLDTVGEVIEADFSASPQNDETIILSNAKDLNALRITTYINI